MLSFVKMLGIIAVMTLIIPLTVWAGSGSWRHGLQAFVAYLRIMGCITGAGLVLAGIFWLAALGAS